MSYEKRALIGSAGRSEGVSASKEGMTRGWFASGHFSLLPSSTFLLESLTLSHAAPHAPMLMVQQRIFETLLTNGAVSADA